MSAPPAQDHPIDSPAGRLFARSWTPVAPRATAPIVLFHDSLGSVDLWRNFPRALCAATGRRIVAYDRLGFGRSAPHPGRLAPDFIAAEAGGGFAALRRQLGIGRCVLFGHSVGGGMAVHAAAACGDDCVALITESAQAFVEERTVRGIEAARRAFQAPDQLARLAKYHGDKAAWVLDAWIGSWLAPEFAAWSLAPVLPLVRCPLLAIHGHDDEYGSPRHPELIGRLAGGRTQVEVMPATRHVPHREAETTVLALAADFLRTLD